jgi:hypothetical protein
MLFDLFEIRFEQRSSAVTARQSLETPELLYELGSAVSTGLLQIVDPEKPIMIQGGLPESDFKRIRIRIYARYFCNSQ